MPTFNERITALASEHAKKLEQPKSTRERAVNCTRCFKRQTWNDNAICEACREN